MTSGLPKPKLVESRFTWTFAERVSERARVRHVVMEQFEQLRRPRHTNSKQ
jgi:hypothetical protein